MIKFMIIYSSFSKGRGSINNLLLKYNFYNKLILTFKVKNLKWLSFIGYFIANTLKVNLEVAFKVNVKVNSSIKYSLLKYAFKVIVRDYNYTFKVRSQIFNVLNKVPCLKNKIEKIDKIVFAIDQDGKCPLKARQIYLSSNNLRQGISLIKKSKVIVGFSAHSPRQIGQIYVFCKKFGLLGGGCKGMYQEVEALKAPPSKANVVRNQLGLSAACQFLQANKTTPECGEREKCARFISISPVFATKTHPKEVSLLGYQKFYRLAKIVQNLTNFQAVPLGGMGSKRHKKLQKFQNPSSSLKIKTFAGISLNLPLRE